MTPAMITNLFPFRAILGEEPVRVRIAPSRRQNARTAVGWFVLAFLGLNAFAFVMMDVARPELRDPEYGRRLTRLQARLAENPGRPLVVVIGSSRAAMGISPAAWEEVRPHASDTEPLLFNMSLVGSGPIMEQLCLRRLDTDGIKPDVVILEYWPAFLREDGPYWELGRIDANRYYRSDRPFIESFATDPAKIEREMLAARWNPIYENRFRWLCQSLPSWLPWTRRMDVTWVGIDKWGWLPGVDVSNLDGPISRQVRLDHCEKIYRAQFENLTIDPRADRALRESIALARANGSQVALTWLPESTEFRGWIPPAVEIACRKHLDELCRELDVPLIDARSMMPDEALADGFHLTRSGAMAFSRRFGPAVAATFPNLEPRR